MNLAFDLGVVVNQDMGLRRFLLATEQVDLQGRLLGTGANVVIIKHYPESPYWALHLSAICDELDINTCELAAQQCLVCVTDR